MPDKNKIILGTNDDTYIAADDAGNIVLQHEEGQRVALTSTSIEPATDETLDLGSATNKFKDLYLSSDSIYIGNTKLSSDPATGGLSTVVADEQGQFTAPAAPVGGGSSDFYDWKGSTKNVAADDPINTQGLISTLSMTWLYRLWVDWGMGSDTGLHSIIWGNYLGNPNTSQSTTINGISLSSGNYDYTTAFITDEDGDDLSAFLLKTMEEKNLQILNFEFSLTARLQVQDPVKAAKIPYFQQGLFQNLTDVTSVPLYTTNQNYMCAFKAAGSNWQGHTRGIMIGSMADNNNYDFPFSPSAQSYGFYNFANGIYPSIFQWNNIKDMHAEVGSDLQLDIDMKLGNPSSEMRSSDHAAINSSYGNYFDLQDGIVFDMLVKLK